MELTKSEVIRRLRANQPYMASNYGLKSIGLFGSYAKGIPTEKSDVDLIVEFDKPIGLKFIEFTEFLESFLERKLDILTPVGLNSIRNPKIAQRIREDVIYVQLIHDYFGVNFDIVWEVLKRDLPELEERITKIIEVLDEKRSN